MRYLVLGLGFMVCSLFWGLGVQGLGFRAPSFEDEIFGLGFRVYGL